MREEVITAGLRIGSGLLLAAFGVFLALSPTADTPAVNAQAGTNYTTTWTATRVLTVDSSGGWANVAPMQNVPIGVSEWQVTGVDTTTGSQLFTETWKVPTASDIVFNPANRTTTGTGFNPAEWLFAGHVGVFGDTPNGGRITYKNQPVSILGPTYTYERGNAKVGGNAIRCSSNSDSNCLHARGAYGWEVYHALSNLGSERGRISASGLMMPLKWTVTGTVN